MLARVGRFTPLFIEHKTRFPKSHSQSHNTQLNRFVVTRQVKTSIHQSLQAIPCPKCTKCTISPGLDGAFPMFRELLQPDALPDATHPLGRGVFTVTPSPFIMVIIKA